MSKVKIVRDLLKLIAFCFSCGAVGTVNIVLLTYPRVEPIEWLRVLELMLAPVVAIGLFLIGKQLIEEIAK